MGAVMSRIDTRAAQGRIEVKNFALSYETLDGSVDAVTDTNIHVNPGEFVSIVGPVGLRQVHASERGRGLSEAHRWHGHR
jgi:predicted ABC-type transport system involved in lysophospholipase L1 biosynthesis ATPase subunit